MGLTMARKHTERYGRIPEGGNMTETASGAASRGGRKAPKGLTIQRIHTHEGVHPYHEVTWQRRDLVLEISE